MSGPAQSGIDTASSRKDAVRKAFNQEYLATQEAMTQAAERARAQVLDQRYTISAHAEDVKAGAQAPLGSQQGGSRNPGAANQAARPQPQGAPYMGANPSGGGSHQVMFDIANEIRNIINQEVERRMQILAARVEDAILQSLPSDDARPENATPENTTSGNATPENASSINASSGKQNNGSPGPAKRSSP